MTSLIQTAMFRNGQSYRSRLTAPQSFRHHQHQSNSSEQGNCTLAGVRSLPLSPSKANYQQIDTLQRPTNGVGERWAPAYSGPPSIQPPPYNIPPPAATASAPGSRLHMQPTMAPVSRLPVQPQRQFQPRNPPTADKLSHIPKAIVNQRPAQAVRPSLRPPAPLTFPRTNPIAIAGASGGDAVNGGGVGTTKSNARSDMFSNFSPRFMNTAEDFRPRTCPPERSGSADILSQTSAAVSDSLPIFQRISDSNSSNSRSAGVLFYSTRAPMQTQHTQQQQQQYQHHQKMHHRDVNDAPTSLPFQKYPASNQMDHFDYLDEGPSLNSASGSVSTESGADSKLTNGSCFNGPRAIDLNSRPAMDPGISVETSKESFRADTQKKWIVDETNKPSSSSAPMAPPLSPPSYPTQLGPRLSDEQLMGLQPGQLLARFRKAEAEITRLMMEHGKTVRELNKQLKNASSETQSIRDEYRRYCEDNQELRDLCCFLDDDRQKGRKLAREWQRFGRYTASVMRQEVSAYQTKLKDLDSKQQDLLKDNLELKELCLYLDEERQTSHHIQHQQNGSATLTGLCMNCGTALNHPRDDGDGSSSSTAAEEPRSQSVDAGDSSAYGSGGSRSGSGGCIDSQSLPAMSDGPEQALQRHRSLLNERILQYIRSLERRIALQSCPNSTASLPEASISSTTTSHTGEPAEVGQMTNGVTTSRCDPPALGATLNRPDAVAQAMLVLDVQEQLSLCPRASSTAALTADFSPNSTEFPDLSHSMYNEATPASAATVVEDVCVENRAINGQRGAPSLDSSEEALIRQMCNVVWKKLEETPS